MSNTKLLASYASHAQKTGGRLFVEVEDSYRTCYQRDRDRIIHSGAFRKLEYKTQVFVNYEGDYYRTRLTHSLEVAQVARSLARRLELNEDLAEGIALAHDLGHTPFGHAGEEALNDVMKQYGGFNHNAQTLRIVTKLEKKYAKFDGLNLTWEMIEGIVKHNGPVINKKCTNKNDVHKFVREYSDDYSINLTDFPSAEAQIASIADDIAYNIHDIDDGIRAGFFTIDELFKLPLMNKISQCLFYEHPELNGNKLKYEVLRKIMTMMIDNIVEQFMCNIKQEHIYLPKDIRLLGKPIVDFSVHITEFIVSLKKFLTNKLYQYYTIRRMTSKAKLIIKQLFEFFYSDVQSLPPEWSRIALCSVSDEEKAIIVCDFIAGMTDRFAMKEHRRIFDPLSEIMFL